MTFELSLHRDFYFLGICLLQENSSTNELHEALMARQNDGTRLPPKTGVRKPQTNKLSKKAIRALLEKESKMKEDLLQQLDEQSQGLSEILQGGGVPIDLM